MKFIVLGAGAVGAYYGAQLARVGHEVTFFARGDNLAVIRAHGMEVRAPSGIAASIHDTASVALADIEGRSAPQHDVTSIEAATAARRKTRGEHRRPPLSCASCAG